MKAMIEELTEQKWASIQRQPGKYLLITIFSFTN